MSKPEQTHTPGPLHTEMADSSYIFGKRTLRIALCNAERQEIGSIAGVFPEAAVCSANARRLAACWNALGGLTTEQIEAGAVEKLAEEALHICRMREKSMLEDCAYQGPPPKKWLKETAPIYEAHNNLLVSIQGPLRAALTPWEELDATTQPNGKTSDRIKRQVRFVNQSYGNASGNR